MKSFLARGINGSDLSGNTAGGRYPNKPLGAPKTITSSWFHAPPPQKTVNSATVCGGPPVASIFLTYSRMHTRCSGCPGPEGEPSASVKSRDSPDSRKCTHRRSPATKASLRPSGESLRYARAWCFRHRDLETHGCGRSGRFFAQVQKRNRSKAHCQEGRHTPGQALA